jgi:hypothetical protein
MVVAVTSVMMLVVRLSLFLRASVFGGLGEGTGNRKENATRYNQQ